MFITYVNNVYYVNYINHVNTWLCQLWFNKLLPKLIKETTRKQFSAGVL